MCGIVAIINKGKNGMLQAQVTAFKQLLFANQLRGMHGTGIFYNNKKNVAKIKTLRAPYTAMDFLDTKEYNECAKVLFSDSNFVVGHNRQATVGGINTQCTHPFKEEKITLVHNGTLNYYGNLDADKKALSDSHAIAISMNKIGEKETIEKLFGAFALVWFNTKDETLNLCRNIQRPLYIIDCENCFIIVSELEMGTWIATRNGLKITKSQEVTPKKLYKFPLDNMAVWNEQDVKFPSDLVYKPDRPADMFDDDYLTSYNRAQRNSYVSKFGAQYKIGDVVKFKGGYISMVNTVPGTSMSGDILIEQDKINPQYLDFEGDWRIKYYGSHAQLKKHENEGNLIGTVKTVGFAFGKAQYIVEDVHFYINAPIMQKSNVLALPQPTKVVDLNAKVDLNANGLTLCGWCSDVIEKGEEHYEDEYTICKNCNDKYGNVVGSC